MSIAQAAARAAGYLTEHCPVSETIARAVPISIEVR
jgi:hypothetical protein